MPERYGMYSRSSHDTWRTAHGLPFMGAETRRPRAPLGAAAIEGSKGARPEPALAFDFVHGQWIAENRKLSQPLTRTAGWVRFDTVHTCRPLLIGLGHIEEIASDDFASFTTLRLFDLENRQWTIHRVSSADGVWRPPLSGRFDSGVGVFVGEDRWCGKPVLVRHTWTRTTGDLHWEQAFSANGGGAWEVNWVADLHPVHWPQ